MEGGDIKRQILRVLDKLEDGFGVILSVPSDIVGGLVNKLLKLGLEPSLEDTIQEKIGGGPHGYGDPADTSMREVEYYLTPRMIWKKVRFEKCASATEDFYNCIQSVPSGEEHRCRGKEREMLECKSHYYSPDHIDAVENECISEYIKLRSEFRKTGSEEDLWKIKMLMLAPSADILHKLRKENKKIEAEIEATTSPPQAAAAAAPAAAASAAKSPSP